MKRPLRSTARGPNPAVVGDPISVPPFGSRAPAPVRGIRTPRAPVGQREYLPSAPTKRAPTTTFPTASGWADSSLAVALATMLLPVGPTDSDSSLWRRPCASSEQASVLNSPGVPLAKPQAGIR